jgi:hypothetical protein
VQQDVITIMDDPFETGEIIFQTVDPFGIPKFPKELNVCLVGRSCFD